jgi:hypothetical protein
MVAKAEIVAAIDTMVKGTHKEWRVGVTNELADHDQFLAERPRWEFLAGGFVGRCACSRIPFSRPGDGTRVRGSRGGQQSRLRLCFLACSVRHPDTAPAASGRVQA